jgi:hypothetical protein
MSPSQIASIVSSGFCALGCLAFVAIYAWRAPWRSTDVGRQIMLVFGTLTAVLIYAVIFAFLPERWQDTVRVIRAIGVSFVGVLLFRQAKMVWDVQRESRDEKGR